MRVGRVVGALVVVALCAGACTSKSSGGDPTSAPPSTPVTTSTSSTASPSPTVSTPTVPSDVPTTGKNVRAGEKPPVEPVLATQHTLDGAAAFAKFFVQTLDWGYATTNGSYLRHYSAPSCIGCENQAGGIDRTRAAGHYYVGGRFSFKSQNASGPLDSPTAKVVFAIPALEVLTNAGKFVTGDPAYPSVTATLTLRSVDGVWQVSEVGFQQ